ncbi:DEAD/DEAH box helicase [Nocardioides sp. AN3]
MSTIHDLLGELRATSLDERDKGDKFERLIQAYLTTDPEWTARFDNVWLWTDWPGRDGRPDTGIDLVAKHRDTDGYAAIQCKFYDEDGTVPKGDIDSFVATSGKAEFTARYIFDTAKAWSKNAEDTLTGLAVPVQRIDINYLNDAPIDWAKYSWSTPEQVTPTGPKNLRPYQRQAISKVREAFTALDRGKLIMACGTGKTFTSLKIAEDLVGAGGSVLFLVPSIQLLSQSLRGWMANAEVDIRPFAVCSDVRVGRKSSTTDSGDISTIDLTEPATTKADKLAMRMQTGKHAKDRMTVVFATYQSIDVVAEAQQLGVPGFDLIICDEAHRTTGVTLAGQDESAFVRVHDSSFLKGDRRLYMTATPRVFGEDVRRKAKDAEAILADMSDETTYGPEVYRLGFSEAVEDGWLTDYKVLVLAVDEQYVADHFQQAMSAGGEIALPDAAKLLGCWNGLAKHYGSADTEAEAGRLAPMRTAVAFAKDIKASKLASEKFPALVERALEKDDEQTATAVRNRLRVEARHVDGTMGIKERNDHLEWLEASDDPETCRILTNARCLSEGVDVPALDAVMFLTPRGSQVDVVQSVGRVMRTAPGKELGYIILPVVVPNGVAPEEALKDNERYRVVWQVLQALRSHDDRFHAMVNQIELNSQTGSSRGTSPAVDISGVPGDEVERPESSEVQGVLDLEFDDFRDAMFARIVAKVGERKYWESWAKDVADIAAAHVTRINGLLKDPDSNQAREFSEFLRGLRETLNESITRDAAIDMLAQHMVTRPVFDALFDGYSFKETNPVARIMELMLASLDEHPMAAETATLDNFYDSVRRRIAGVDNAAGKQKVLVELYDKFFATAFKKTVDKLGIVYTPVEIVDFILRSADDVLRAEFGHGLTDEGVHVLDPFTGTGTFMVRLLQSGLIEPHDLARKYATELHASEILLLAYYIATVNIETTYADLINEQRGELAGVAEPVEFPGLVLTDTFQSWEPDDTPDLAIFAENNERLQRLKGLPITVIVGNPPYSSGQDSANDNNANEKYPSLDEEIRKTYAERSNATNKNSLYDSYIRAIKWATLRIKDRGVIAYVTNGGFLDSNTADGMRKTLAEEFSSIYIYNLRGNQRTAGEQSRKEGGKIFGGGSRATVAITLLVKDSHHQGLSKIHYEDVGDYLTREEKLARVADAGSVSRLSPTSITPNPHGDWLNQRRDDFDSFLAIGDRESRQAVFDRYGPGMQTNRDVWVYGSSEAAVEGSMTRTIPAYNSEVERWHALAKAGDDRAVADFVNNDATKISWSRSLRGYLRRGTRSSFDQALISRAQYRPFNAQRFYFDRTWNHEPGVVPATFPPGRDNHGIYVTGPSAAMPFTALAVRFMPDQATYGAQSNGQLFARWRFELCEDSGMLDLGGDGEVVNGYRMVDNITDQALVHYQAAFPNETITKDDIFYYVYGLMHSPTYRETYAADLKKALPRIPIASEFRGFVDAGRRLSELHLGYEEVPPYPLDGLDVEATGDPYDFFAVGAKKMPFGKPTTEQKAAGERHDRTVIRYNDRITLSGIPLEAYRYMLGSRSAIEWIIDRYYVKTDKASGIVNDPNDWSREVQDPRYILDLLARIVTVSLETMKIVDALPELDIIDKK